jgi:hypothetical protein
LFKDATMRRVIFCLFSAILWFGNTPILRAQETPAGTEPPKAEAVAPAEAGKKPEPPREVYLPFKFLKGIFDSQGASVVIPLEEYQRLKAAAEKPVPPAPAVSAVITSGLYTATIEQDLARIKAELTVNVLGTPWVEVPIRFGDAAIGKLEAGEKVLLKGTGDGNYSLLFGQAGEQKITIELTAKVHTSPEGREFGFDVPTTGITTFEITIPEADQTIEVTPRLITVPVEAAEKQSKFKANLGSTPRISARWRPKATSKPEMELLASVTNYTKVGVEDGLIHTDAIFAYEVLRGELAQLRIAVPKDHRILDVSADSRLKGWQAKEEDGRQIVTIDLLGGQTGKFNVEVHTERKIPDESFDVAGGTDAGTVGIHALDVVRESGQIGLGHSADLTLTVEDQSGVVRIDANELHERLRGERVTSFKYYSPRFTLKASVKPVEPRVLVDQVAQLVFNDDELGVQSTLIYTIERAGLFQLQLKLPEGLVIDNVECPGFKEFNADPATKMLTVNLNDKTMGQLNLSVKAHRDYSTGMEAGEITLPMLEPIGAERDTGRVFVFAKESIEVVTNDKGLASAQPLPVDPGMAIGDAKVTSSWSFTRRPVTIPVKTSRKPTRLNAEIATTAHLTPELSEIKTHLTFLVQYAGIDTFRFLVPEAVSDRVQIESVAANASSPGIKQKSPAAAQGGWVEWTVVMQREVLGPQRFNISYDLKPEQAAGTTERKIAVQIVRPLGYQKGETKTPLSQVTGELVITKDDSLAVSALATGGDVEPMDVRELTLLPQTGTQSFRYFTQPEDAGIQLAITQTKYEIEEVVATVVSKALVEVVTGETSEATYLAHLLLKTSERQRLLAHLPKGMKPLNVTVAGREVQLEHADIPDDQKLGDLWETHWINVARETSSDQEFTVSLHFQYEVNPPLGDSTYGRGALEVPMPVLGQKGTVPVQQLKTIIYVPEKFSLVGDPAGFYSVDRSNPWWALLARARRPSDSEYVVNRERQWFGAAENSARLPTQGRVAYAYSNLGGASQITLIWWNRVGMAFLFSLAAGAVAVLLMRTSVDNKLSVLMVALFVAVLYGLKDSQTLAHVLYAVRFGLLFLIGLWTVKTVFARRALAATVMAAAPLAATVAPVSEPTVASTTAPPNESPPPPTAPPSSDPQA